MSHPPPASAQPTPTHPPSPRAGFRRTLVRVLVVQVVTLALLGLLQILYS